MASVFYTLEREVINEKKPMKDIIYYPFSKCTKFSKN